MKKEVNEVNEISDIKEEEVKKPVRKAAKKVDRTKSEKKSEINLEVTDVNKMLKEREKKLSKAVNVKKKIIVEYYGKQVSEDLIIEKLISNLMDSGFQEEVKTLNIYFKAEEETAYCIVNDGEPIVIRYLS